MPCFEDDVAVEFGHADLDLAGPEYAHLAQELNKRGLVERHRIRGVLREDEIGGISVRGISLE